ncbi:unnamed protein product [Mytilus coruscus]|uniref:Neurotransmitter-gated ion-channel transmembrane domain-containing protein n=1 Tax=Mytilus coruscus TaxID=42192 RepID=A0A6J8BQU9_MYTCO|nr:unnamed protein product [Mytilus coruscus]
MVALPTNMFFLLNPLVFLLPVESGERLGLAMTILLSYAIFLTMVQMSIPASSNLMSVLLIIMIVTIVISGITAAATIYISSLYHREPHVKMNSFWKFIGTRLPWSKTHTSVKPVVNNDGKGDMISSPLETSITWQEVCHALDTLMMIAVMIWKPIAMGNSLWIVSLVKIKDSGRSFQKKTFSLMIKQTENQNTKNNTKWAFNFYEKWRLSREGVVPELLNMNSEDMDFWLQRFIVEARRKDGVEYPPKSLYLITCVDCSDILEMLT